MEDLGDIIVNVLCCCGKTVTKGNTNQGTKYKKVRKDVKFTKIARKAGSMAIEATTCIVSKLAEGSADVSDDYEILAS
ncbi:hypothetical protein DPMN_009171 [Dreissena polymorpha]|uniref:Uncharacterized protein n=1 Tax=Dreissena polymorpha TaxID=45954 RepID=A0A9D4RZT9_DREPO|nr:hypothetical protein DPMN_009171 [Dreissena polymorpha]